MHGVWSRLASLLLMGMLRRALKNKDWSRGEPLPSLMATHNPVSVRLFLRRFTPLFHSEFWKPTTHTRGAASIAGLLQVNP